VGTFDVLFKFLHGTHHETEFIYTISYWDTWDFAWFQSSAAV
jgi:hypothetical protein